MILCLSFQVHAAKLSAYGSRFSFSGEEYAVSFSSGNISIRSKYFSTGEIGRFGLLRTISDPYSSVFSLRPEVSVHQRNVRQSGVAIGIDALTAGFSLDERPFVFAYSGNKYIEGALLFAFPGIADDESYLENGLSSSPFPILYAGIGGGWKFFRTVGIASFSPEMGVELFGAAGLYWGKYSVYILGGDTIPIYGRRDGRTWGLKVSIGEAGFRSDFSVVFGRAPVYSSDFLPVRASIRSELEIHGLMIYSSMEYSFSAKGKVHKRDRIIFRYQGFSIGYDTEGGAIISYEHDVLEIGYEDRKVYAEITIDLGSDMVAAEIRLSSDGSAETALSISL